LTAAAAAANGCGYLGYCEHDRRKGDGVVAGTIDMTVD